MFELDHNQRKALNAWIDTKEEKYCGAIGGRYTYSFTPNSLGVGVIVTDNISKDSIDLTDYGGW